MSASELHNLRNSILIDVKSILLSSKDGLTERELCREYKYLNGRDIQYSRLGFNSLYDFLQSLVDESVIYHQRRPPNLIVYFAKEESCTYQLRNLVSGQKDSLAKERDMRRYREASSSYRFNNRFSNRGQTSNSYSTNKGGTVPYYIQCEIKQVLENAKGKPLSRQEFKRNYYQLFPKYIDCEKFGFEDIKELLESLKGLVEVRPCPNDEYTVSLIYESSKAQTTAPLAATTTTTAKSKPIDKENTEAATIGDYAKLNDVMKQGSEIVENLKVLIKSFDDKGGLWARTIPTEYKKLFKKELNVGSIGYRYPIDLLDDKLGDFLQTKRPDKYGDYLIFSKEYQQMCNDGQGNNNDKSNLNGEENGDGEDEIEELNHINNVKQLTKEIRRLFRRDTVNFERNKLYKVNEFTELFETKAGWKLHLKNYGCVTISQLFMKLCDEKLFEFKHENETIYIKYKRENSELTSQVVPTASEYVANYDESSEFMQQKTSSTATSLNGGAGIRVGGKNDSEKVIFMQKFLTEYVFYNETLDPYKVLEDVDLSVECNIIVSHIINPFEMSIQIAKNVPKLNLLMDDLENAYLGVGASHYNMTHEYIQIGKYCAAIFPGDKNWHRCKILEIDDKKKLARVSFIDYGGEAWVSMNELKFLCRRFMNLPQQALLARLSNVDYMNVAGKRWDENVTNYLLKIVQSKVFKAKFDGAVFSLLSCSLYELDSTGKSIYCLNKRIIKDGHATEMKDKSIVSSC